MKEIIKSIGLTNKEREDLIIRANNQEYMEQILKGEIDLGLGSDALSYLVINNNSIKPENKREFCLKCFQNNDYKFTLDDKIELLRMIDDKDMAKKFLTDTKMSMNKQSQLLRIINDKEYSRDFIDRQEEPLKTYLMDDYILYTGSEEEKKQWNEKITTITDISKLSLEELEKMLEDTMIRIVGNGNKAPQQQLYSKSTYTNILKQIDKMFGDIPIAEKGNSESEAKTFLEVYNRLGKIPYDEYAITEEGKEEAILQISSRNLVGGILDGKCVYAGYSEILRNILALKNIDAKYISANEPDGNGHAWNQVKIGDKWFNVDLTFDRDEIFEKLQRGERIGVEVLKTDEEFKEHAVYSENRTEIEETCNTKITDILKAPVYEMPMPEEKTSEIQEEEVPIYEMPMPETITQNIGMQVEDLSQTNNIRMSEMNNAIKQIYTIQQAELNAQNQIGNLNQNNIQQFETEI